MHVTPEQATLLADMKVVAEALGGQEGTLALIATLQRLPVQEGCSMSLDPKQIADMDVLTRTLLVAQGGAPPGTAVAMARAADAIRDLLAEVERLSRGFPPFTIKVPASDEMRLAVLEAMKAEMQPIVRVAEDAAALRDEVERLRAMLREVEWSADTMPEGVACCPACDGEEPTHAPDCRLAALLR